MPRPRRARAWALRRSGARGGWRSWGAERSGAGGGAGSPGPAERRGSRSSAPAAGWPAGPGVLLALLTRCHHHPRSAKQRAAWVPAALGGGNAHISAGFEWGRQNQRRRGGFCWRWSRGRVRAARTEGHPNRTRPVGKAQLRALVAKNGSLCPVLALRSCAFLNRNFTKFVRVVLSLIGRVRKSYHRSSLSSDFLLNAFIYSG